MFDNYLPATRRCHPNLLMRGLKQRMTFSHRQRSMGADAPALQAPVRGDAHDERSDHSEHKQREAQACHDTTSDYGRPVARRGSHGHEGKRRMG
jgi:hypothetical protein